MTANNTQNESVENLKEEFLAGIFPTGAKWPIEKINRCRDETRVALLAPELVGSLSHSATAL